MATLFDDRREIDPLNLLPEKINILKDISWYDAFMLQVLSINGGIRTKTECYNLVKNIGKACLFSVPYSIAQKDLSDALTRLIDRRAIMFISGEYVAHSLYADQIAQLALKDDTVADVFGKYHSMSISWSMSDAQRRFCLFTGTMKMGKNTLEFFSYHGAENDLVAICNSLGDFSLLTNEFLSKLNTGVLQLLLEYCILNLEVDDDFNSKLITWFATLSNDYKTPAFFPLISHLSLFATPSEIEDLTNIYAKHIKPQWKGLLNINFVADMLRGDYDIAIHKAEQLHLAWTELQEHKKKELPFAMGGFYAILLYRKDTVADLNKALTFTRSSIRSIGKDHDESNFMIFLKLLLDFLVAKQKVTNPQFGKTLYVIDPSVFSITWLTILQKWFNNDVKDLVAGSNVLTFADVNSRLELELRSCGYTNESEDGPKLYKELQKRLNISPLSECIQPKEQWREMLKLLESASNTKRTVKKTANDRIVWRINVEDKDIVPVLQKQSRGVWTSGRNIALRTLFSKIPACASEQDIQIINHLKRDQEWSGVYYYWVFDKAIAEMVEHPLLFTITSPMLPIEIKREEVEIIVKEKGDKTNIKFSYPYGDVLVKEKDRHYKYLVWDKGLEVFARGLTNSGMKQLSLPKEGKEQATELLTKFSQRVAVKGDFDDPNLIKKTAKNKVLIRLQPIAGDLNATILIEPLPKEDINLHPGVGAGEIIHRTASGKRIQIKRSLKKEISKLTDLKNSIPSLMAMEDNNITFEDESETLHFLGEMRELHPEVELRWPKGESLKVAKVASMSDFNIGVKSDTDWFELSGKMELDDNKVWTIKELLEASAGGSKSFVKLDDNTFVKLQKSLKKRLAELNAIGESKGDTIRVHRLGAPAITDIVEEAGKSRTDKQWKDNIKKTEELRNFEPALPPNLDATLRPYQQDGYNWLSRLHAWGVGACLADDMGLGKTIQSIALMLKHAGDGPSLVIAPSSVCPNWHKELLRFAPSLNAVSLTGQKRSETIDELKPFDVLIVTYGLIQSNPDLLADKQWNITVLDEAHAIKNANSIRSKAAHKLQAKFKLITTGTPIQNHLGELWNLFHFINPGFLGSQESFNQRFVNGSSDEIPHKRKALNRYIQPFILRRNKTDVLDDLPQKTEITLTVEQSEQERALYEAMRQKAVEDIESSEEKGGAAHMEILAQISKLRLASCNPRLVNGGSNLSSSKMNALEELVDNLLNANHKALVFSQFTKHLALIKEMLDKKGIKYQYLDGSCTTKAREKAIVDFQSGKSDLFLISLKAGGVGLNLTAADYVIHMDPWWNPAIEDQASDRAHRIGQTRPVTVYRLVAEGTIEEKIVKLHHDKRDLATQLLTDTDKSAKISSNDLFNLMK